MSRRSALTGVKLAGPVRLSMPYRGWFQPPYNAAAPLSIPVVGTGVGAMHPDVLDFGGSPFAGYRYWMGMTPYNFTASTELPSVVATNDLTSGGTWSVPTGYTNPVTNNPAGGHMADTDLVFDASTGRLHLLYVSTDESTYQDVRGKWTTGDGTWSAEVVVLAGGQNAYTNPSVIKTATGWRMYYTRDTGPLDGIYYRDTTTAPDAGYGAEQTATLSLDFGVYSRKMQNLNMVCDTDGSLVAIVSDGGSDGLGGTLMFARSTDGGSTFTITGPPVVDKGGTNDWDGGGIYRSSVMVDTTSTVVLSGTDVHLWYSAYMPNKTTWGTGYRKIPVAFLRL